MMKLHALKIILLDTMNNYLIFKLDQQLNNYKLVLCFELISSILLLPDCEDESKNLFSHLTLFNSVNHKTVLN